MSEMRRGKKQSFYGCYYLRERQLHTSYVRDITHSKDWLIAVGCGEVDSLMQEEGQLG